MFYMWTAFFWWIKGCGMYLEESLPYGILNQFPFKWCFASPQLFRELSKKIKMSKNASVNTTVNICMLVHSQIAKGRKDKGWIPSSKLWEINCDHKLAVTIYFSMSATMPRDSDDAHTSDLRKCLQLYQLRSVSKPAFSMRHLQWSLTLFYF